MATLYGGGWEILEDTYRYTPDGTPRILIQIESSGYADSPRYYRQRVVVNGSEVLSANAPRSYRVSRLTQNPATGQFTYQSSNGYDVYGSSTNATNLDTYLNTFDDGDLMILNTNDEPNNNRGVFQTNLVNNFGANLQSSGVWASRISYMLISIKGKPNPIYETIEARYGDSIRTTLWLR